MTVPVASSLADFLRKRILPATGSMSRPLTRTRRLPLVSHVFSSTLRMHVPAAVSFAKDTLETHSGGGLGRITSPVELPTDEPPGPMTVVVTWCSPAFGKACVPVIEPSDPTLPGLFVPSPQSMTALSPGPGGTNATTPVNGVPATAVNGRPSTSGGPRAAGGGGGGCCCEGGGGD